MNHAERALRRQEPIEVQRARVRTVGVQIVDGFRFEHEIVGEGFRAYVAWRVLVMSNAGPQMIGYVRRDPANSQRWFAYLGTGAYGPSFKTRTEAAEWLERYSKVSVEVARA